MGADPFTIMAFAAAANSVVSGIGAAKAGKANKAVHDHNASILRQRANEYIKNASYNADMLRDREKRLLAKNATMALKSGVEIAGSPLEVLGQNAADIEHDAQLEKHKGKLQAWEAQTEAANQEYMGAMADWRGKQQKRAAFMSAGISFVGGVYGATGGFDFGSAAPATGIKSVYNGGGVSMYNPMKPSSYSPILY